MKRDDGYYWVKSKENNWWIIAYWSLEMNCFYVDGFYTPEGDFLEINETKLEEPK